VHARLRLHLQHSCIRAGAVRAWLRLRLQHSCIRAGAVRARLRLRLQHSCIRSPLLLLLLLLPDHVCWLLLFPAPPGISPSVV
jgi:hypothetical protein